MGKFVDYVVMRCTERLTHTHADSVNEGIPLQINKIYDTPSEGWMLARPNTHMQILVAAHVCNNGKLQCENSVRQQNVSLTKMM